MTRRLLSFFLAFCMLLTPLSALALSDEEMDSAEAAESADAAPYDADSAEASKTADASDETAAGDTESVAPPDSVDAAQSDASDQTAALMADSDFEINADGTLTKYNGSGGDVVIPDSVTSIEGYAFSGCSGLTGVTIPDSVTSIGNRAFSGCSALTDVYYGGSEAEWAAISIDGGNDSLTRATMYYNSAGPDIVASGECGDSLTWTLYGNGVLLIKGTGDMSNYTNAAPAPWADYRADIKTVRIGEGVTSVGNFGFQDCAALTAVTIPDGVTKIGESAFSGCAALPGVALPDTLDSIGNAAFKGCSLLSALTIPAAVTTVGAEAFYNSAALGAVMIPDSVTSLGDSAFGGCAALASVTIGKGLTEIPRSAFSGSGLTAVTIPDGVTSLGKYAFYNCTSLASVTIPVSVTTVTENAFEGCSALADVYYAGTEEQWNAIATGESNEPLTEATLHCADSDAETLVFVDSDEYDIPATDIRVDIEEIRVFGGVSGGTPPYTFTAEGLPKGVSISWAGVISGAPTEVAEASTATVTVTDSAERKASVEIAVGAVQSRVEGYDTLKGMDLSGKFINVVFVVDTTGSMEDVILNVRDTLKGFVYALSETGARLRIALIDYKDTESDGEDTTVLHHLGDSYWYENTDIDELVEEISKLEADGGGDTPESVIDAYGNLVKTDIGDGMSFNVNAAKFSFLLTDAEYKTGNRYGLTGMDDLIERLNSVSVRKDGTKEGVATSVITGTSNFSEYTDLTEKTGGILIDLSGDFAEAMETFAAEIALTAADYVEEDDIIRVEGISFDKDVSIPIGRVRNFAPTFKPRNASDKSVAWTIENGSVLSKLDKSSNVLLVIRAGETGETRIVAHTTDGGYTADFTLSIPGDVALADGVMETCDIARLKDYAKSPEGTVELIYYNDATGETSIGEADQKEAYAAVAESGQILRFIFDDEIGNPLYGWTFDGKRIARTDTAFNMRISASDFVPATKTAEYKLEQFHLLEFAHEGDLPGEAEARVATNLTNGDYNLYFYDEDDDALTETAPVTVADGIASFSLSATKKYGVIGEPKREYATSLKALDASTSEPLPNASFSLTDSRGVVTECVAGADGTATVRIKHGTYSLRVRADGYSEKSDEIKIVGEAEEHVIYLNLLSVEDDETPVAKLSPTKITVPVKSVVAFNASASTDNLGIANYAWNFGDGSSVSGKDASVSHAFAAEGSYTVTLTVADAAGNSDSATASVAVISAESAVQITALDTVSGKPVPGAKISVADGAEYATGPDGKTFLSAENGTYAVSASADGYQERNFSMQVTDDNRAFTVYLNAADILRVETAVKELTKEEAVAAGIDTDAPENQHVYQSTAVFEFGELTYIHNDSAVLDYTPLKTGKITAYPVARDVYLIVYSQVNWLKELFRVQLYVQNTSNFERIEDCSANLTLPDGLSLAVMTEEHDPQSLNVSLGAIAPGSEIGHNWYLCGDEAGEYELSGAVSGVRVNEDDTIREDTSADFATSEKISVLAGDAMTLTITAEKYGVVGVPYHVVYKLENVSKKTLYDVRLSVMGGKFVEDYDASDLEYDPDEAASGSLEAGFSLYDETFVPGEKLTGIFTVKFGKGLDVRQGMEYVLKEMFSVTGAESTTEIPTTFKLTNNERILLTYNANGGDGQMEPRLVEKSAETSAFVCELPRCSFIAPEGKRFKAWLVDGTEYAPGDNCSFTEDATLLAAWEDDIYEEGVERKITFDTAGGETEVVEMTVTAGEAYGELPTPVREGYAFAGWHTAADGGEEVKTSDTVTLSRDVTLYAHWTPLSYSIRWLSDDGTELWTDSVPYGEMPVYGGETPQKADDERFSYVFSVWTPEIAPVSGDAVYTAAYNPIRKFFTVTWMNYNGATLKTDDNVPRGQVPAYDGPTPERVPVGATAYVFSGWKPEVEPVTADAFYTAVYESVPRTHTITWVNEDGTTLETDENVPYGEIPTYDGETPTKESDVKYAYAFSGWTRVVRPVKDDMTYTATYSRTLRTYTVTWVNEDGTTLETDENVPYGQTPAYDGATPVKEPNPDNGESYVFTKWVPEIAPVSGDAVYTAAYRPASAAYIEGVSVSGEMVTATLDCSEVGAVALCAVYNENGQIIALESLPASSDRRVYRFEFKGYAFDYAKAFLIGGDMRSLCVSAQS